MQETVMSATIDNFLALTLPVSPPHAPSGPQQCDSQAVEVREAADECAAQAGAAGQRATAAEQQAQHLEAQGKFADAAAAALQADRSAMFT